MAKFENIITRFAPSPTGHLHIGHAYAAAQAFNFAKRHNGQCLLRIEDIDTSRCKPEFTQQIISDLHWLGHQWPEPVMVQSTRLEIYRQALQTLIERAITYPCFCTRKEIAAANKHPPGPEGIVYPGTCEHLDYETTKKRITKGEPYVIRLKMDSALGLLKNHDLHWIEGVGLEAEPQKRLEVAAAQFGDIVLARKDTPTSYHLSVVVDDAAQGVTDVVRGQDLYFATHIHIVLQALLGLPHPRYHHHPLLTHKGGPKLSKSDKHRPTPTIKSIRDQGLSLDDLEEMITDHLKAV